jgi:DNA-binding PadR family transcriptional regulator
MMHARRHRRHHHATRRNRYGHPMWGMGRGRFFQRGELRLALLSLIGDGPQHGYELMKQLEGRSGGMYRASAGSVYPTLQQIEDEGLALSEQSDGKRVYQITDDGTRELESEADAIRRIWRRAEEWGDWRGASSPEIWEIARPARQLAKAALRAVAGSSDDTDRIERIRSILERATREIRDLDEND